MILSTPIGRDLYTIVADRQGQITDVYVSYGNCGQRPQRIILDDLQQNIKERLEHAIIAKLGSNYLIKNRRKRTSIRLDIPLQDSGDWGSSGGT